MGTDWKIYKPKSKIALKDLRNDFNRIIELHCDDEKIVNINSQSIDSAKKMIEMPSFELDKLGLEYVVQPTKELINLCSDDIEEYKFFWLGSENIHGKSENIKFQFTYNLHFNKIELLINLPYHNKSKSIEQSIEFIKQINEPLDLHFRNDEEIEKDITNFIELNLDNKYYDNEWTLKHSHYSFKASGASKQIFENNIHETFRLTGFRIIFPETFIRLVGFKKYSQNILSSLINYFNESNLEIYVFGKSSKLIDKLSEFNPIETENKLEFKFKKGIIDTVLENPNLFFEGKMNEFRCDKMKFDPSDEHCFTISLYGENIDALEFSVQISKNAHEVYIKRVLSLFSCELTYKYEE